MAILSTKKNTKAKKAVKAESLAKPVSSNANPSNLSGILLHPHITEKASMQAEGNVYVFSIAHCATKHTVASAVKEMYKVTPEKVNIVFTPAKKVFIRGKAGMKSRIKKAYVFLKKGEKIEVV